MSTNVANESCGIGRLLRACAVVALVASVTGCGTPRVTMATRQEQVTAPRTPAGSIFVISHVGRADESWATPFATHMKAILEDQGFRSQVQTRSALAVQADRAAYADEITKFAPDLWLVVEPGDGTVDRDGKNLSRRFEAGLFKRGADGGQRMLIWRASILVEPTSSNITAQDMDELAASLARKLRQDGFVAAGRENTAAPVGPSGTGTLKQE